MATLVDTNILLDVIDVGSAFEAWSTARLLDARRGGALVINPIIYAEMAAGFDSEGALESLLSPSKFDREDLPWQAAFLAGKAFLQYRQAGGPRRSPLPDFYIGAHALVRGHTLMTRDRARYLNYFPMLRVISPETHP